MMNACKVAPIDRTIVLKITKLGLEIYPNFRRLPDTLLSIMRE